MSTHFFLAPAAVPPFRWREAFPHAQLLNDATRLPVPAPGDLVWLVAELPNWRGVLAKLRQTSPHCVVVLLTLQPDQTEALAGLELGARGYCHALSAPSLLREVATVVAHGGVWVGTELMQRLLGALSARIGGKGRGDARAFSALSERESSVAERVAAGLSNKEVARDLDITERTVKAHLTSIFDKLGVRDRLQLVLRYGRSESPASIDR